MQHFIQNFIQVDYGYAPVFNEPEGTYGRIYIEEAGEDSFTEHFYMCEKTWAISDYVQQWEYAWAYLKKNEITQFVVNVQEHNLFLVTWGLYKIKGRIHIQNYLFSENNAKEVLYDKRFSPQNAFFFFQERAEYCERYKVSEWVVEPTEQERKLLNM